MFNITVIFFLLIRTLIILLPLYVQGEEASSSYQWGSMPRVVNDGKYLEREFEDSHKNRE